jgi:hypothetical protein
MILARAAGIPIFVTGGIGGVHRGAEQCNVLIFIMQEVFFIYLFSIQLLILVQI